MAAENIRVYFKPLLSVGGKTFYHETLVYTASDGQQFYATAYASKDPNAGNPGGIAGTAMISSGLAGAASAAATNGASPYGTLTTQWGRVTDLSDEERKHWLGPPDHPYFSQTVKVGDDLAGSWSKIEQAYFQVGEQGLPYSPDTQNSNSTASTGLTAGDASLPAGTWIGGDHWAPASSAILPTSMTPATPVPAFQPDAVYSSASDFYGNFPRVPDAPLPSSGASAAGKLRVSAFDSSAPAGPDGRPSFDSRFGNWGSAPAIIAPSASDQPESFDNRFGNWGTAPAGRFGDTGSPVLRALEKYRRSAAPDGPASAPAQGASWGMPSSPPNIIGTGGVLGSYTDPSRGMPSYPPGVIGTGGVLGNYMDPSLIAPAQGALPTSSASSGPIAPDLPADEAEIAGSKPVRYLSSRIAGQPQASISNPSVQPAPPQSSEPLVGIFYGQPMFPFPPPPSLWRRPDNTRSRSDDEEEQRWLRLFSPP